MTTQVNSPFLLPKIRPQEGSFEDAQSYLAELERIIQQLYRRSGATSDDFSRNSLIPMTLSSAGMGKEADYYSISSTHTTASQYEVLVCTADLTINLSNDSQDRTRIRVKVDGNYTVTVEGNAQTINGESTIILYVPNTLVDFVYYAEKGEWIIE